MCSSTLTELRTSQRRCTVEYLIPIGIQIDCPEVPCPDTHTHTDTREGGKTWKLQHIKERHSQDDKFRGLLLLTTFNRFVQTQVDLRHIAEAEWSKCSLGICQFSLIFYKWTICSKKLFFFVLGLWRSACNLSACASFSDTCAVFCWKEAFLHINLPDRPAPNIISLLRQ